MTIRLTFLGAAGCVTGSAFLVKSGQARILVDCGMFQGSKTLKALNYEPFPFQPAKLDAVLLTHAHVDHSGLLPKLALAGFDKKIFATKGTIELCRVLLPDSGAIQEMEVESLNRRRHRRGEGEVEPIFTRADADETMTFFQAAPMKIWIDVAPGMRAKFWNAGHILGAASIELEVTDEGETQTLMFSGDVGPGGRDFAMDPEGPSGVDHLILESTYGDTERSEPSVAARRDALKAEMLAAHAAGGPLLIPAFAVERTQELIVDLLELMESGAGPRGPIFLDSPLGIRASDTFLKHGSFENGDNPFARLRASPWLRYTESVAESQAIERMRGWHIIIASSGMCDAGRVRHHLKRLLWRDEATVLLTGFQAVGTLGRLLQEGRKAVRIQGDEIKVRARVRSIGVYSGHADANGLIAWAKARAPRGAIFLTHGEPESSAGLRRRLAKAGFDDDRIVIAALDQTQRLKRASRSESEPHPARVPAAQVAGLDWHNRRSDLLTRLNAALDTAGNDAAREDLIKGLAVALEAKLASDQSAAAPPA